MKTILALMFFCVVWQDKSWSTFKVILWQFNYYIHYYLYYHYYLKHIVINEPPQF